MGIGLAFQEGRCALTVNGNDDTVIVREGHRQTQNKGEFAVDAAGIFPWNQALSKSVAWAWTMQNQQGYEDAVQMHYHDADGTDSDTVIQIVAAASELQVFVLSKVEGNGSRH